MMYQLLHFFLKLLSSIPFRVLYALSDGLYYLLYYGVGYRRKVVRRNLTECFPEKELPEIKRIEKQFYRFFVDMVFESAKMTTISAEEISRRMKFINAEGGERPPQGRAFPDDLSGSLRQLGVGRLHALVSGKEHDGRPDLS